MAGSAFDGRRHPSSSRREWKASQRAELSRWRLGDETAFGLSRMKGLSVVMPTSKAPPGPVDCAARLVDGGCYRPDSEVSHVEVLRADGLPTR